MIADPGDERAPYLVRFVPSDGRPAVWLARAWVRKAGLRETFGHAARLMAEGEHGAVELVEEGIPLFGERVLQRETF